MISGLTSERLKRTKQQIQVMEEEKKALRDTLKKRETEIAQLQASIKKAKADETAQVSEKKE